MRYVRQKMPMLRAGIGLRMKAVNDGFIVLLAIPVAHYRHDQKRELAERWVLNQVRFLIQGVQLTAKH